MNVRNQETESASESRIVEKLAADSINEIQMQALDASKSAGAEGQSFTMLIIPYGLREDVQRMATQLRLYQNPRTSEHWLDHNNGESFTMCPHAVRMAKILFRVEKCIPVEKGYTLPSPRLLHSKSDPYGRPWPTDHRIGRVIHCENAIRVDDPGRGQNQSLVQRLYHEFGDKVPADLCGAIALTQRDHHWDWFTMNTIKAREQGVQSRCKCCYPPRVLVIAWNRGSSPSHRRACQQKLQAWVGLQYDELSLDAL